MIDDAADDGLVVRAERISEFEAGRDVGFPIEVVEVLKGEPGLDRGFSQEERVRRVNAPEPFRGALPAKPFLENRLGRPEFTDVAVEEIPVADACGEPVSAEIGRDVFGAARPGRERGLEELSAHEPMGVAVSRYEEARVGEARVEPGSCARKFLETFLVCRRPDAELSAQIEVGVEARILIPCMELGDGDGLDGILQDVAIRVLDDPAQLRGGAGFPGLFDVALAGESGVQSRKAHENRSHAPRAFLDDDPGEGRGQEPREVSSESVHPGRDPGELESTLLVGDRGQSAAREGFSEYGDRRPSQGLTQLIADEPGEGRRKPPSRRWSRQTRQPPTRRRRETGKKPRDGYSPLRKPLHEVCRAVATQAKAKKSWRQRRHSRRHSSKIPQR